MTYDRRGTPLDEADSRTAKALARALHDTLHGHTATQVVSALSMIVGNVAVQIEGPAQPAEGIAANFYAEVLRIIPEIRAAHNGARPESEALQ